MKPKVLRFTILVCTSVYFVFHFLFFWINQHGDGYYYLAFSEYLKTGKYPFLWPYMYARPTTIAAPLYSMVLSILTRFPHAEHLLHAYHLILLAGTAWLLYRLLKKFIPEMLSLVISCVFTMMPTSMIFAGYNMTEITAQFLFMAWLLIAVNAIEGRGRWTLPYLVLVSSIATLAKYQFALLFVASGIWWMFRQIPEIRLSGIRHIVTVKYAVRQIPVIFGVLVIISWICINWNITGVFGLSDTNKLRFHASVVYDGQNMLPEKDPAAVELRKYIPENLPLTLAWWDYQKYILPKTKNDWREVDRLVGNVGLAVMRRNPMLYPKTILSIFWKLHTYRGQPWWINISTVGEKPDPALPLYCKRFGGIQFCKPLIMTPVSYRLWNAVTIWMRDLYLATAPVIFVGILFPAIAFCLVFGKSRERFFAGLYLFEIGSISGSIFTDTRYLVVFYPLMILIIASTLGRISFLLRGKNIR